MHRLILLMCLLACASCSSGAEPGLASMDPATGLAETADEQEAVEAEEAALEAVEAADAAAAAADAVTLAPSLVFHGDACTEDCSGHEAGYQWAEENEIQDPYDCGGNSDSFIEGCESYAEEQQARQAEEEAQAEIEAEEAEESSEY